MSDCVPPDAFVRGRAKRDGRKPGNYGFCGQAKTVPFAWLRVGVAVGRTNGSAATRARRNRSDSHHMKEFRSKLCS